MLNTLDEFKASTLDSVRETERRINSQIERSETRLYEEINTREAKTIKNLKLNTAEQITEFSVGMKKWVTKLIENRICDSERKMTIIADRKHKETRAMFDVPDIIGPEDCPFKAYSDYIKHLVSQEAVTYKRYD